MIIIVGEVSDHKQEAILQCYRLGSFGKEQFTLSTLAVAEALRDTHSAKYVA